MDYSRPYSTTYRKKDLLEEIVSHLSSELGVRVALERPATPPSEMVTVVRSGGGGSMFLDRATVTVHAWSTSESGAYSLARKAEDAMFSLPSAADNVAEVTQNSLYSNIYPDGTRRWSGAYIIAYNR